ncbi:MULTISPECIES: hypothetical protein [Bradyrhizobium]|uniref:hypothetical protein n=1 Tax=Bradyrhizobium TaxID=374 RepID=UPI000415DE82|nr:MULTISPECIES: hypothetical protein [Bradyrhizobium]UFW48561.1 hypothetical protein BaraCB756_41000 [Bradyrhizobium arachidis]
MTSPTAPSSDAPPAEVINAYFEAMTAAFQVLVLTLQSNGSLKQGEYQEALRVYMEVFKHKPNCEITLALLNELRQGMLN